MLSKELVRQVKFRNEDTCGNSNFSPNHGKYMEELFRLFDFFLLNQIEKERKLDIVSEVS